MTAHWTANCHWTVFGIDPLTGERVYYGIEDRVNKEMIATHITDRRYAQVMTAAPKAIALLDSCRQFLIDTTEPSDERAMKLGNDINKLLKALNG